MDTFDVLRGAVVGAFSISTFGILTAIIYYHALKVKITSSCKTLEPTAKVLTALSYMNFVAAVWFTATFMLRFLAGLELDEAVTTTILLSLANYLIAYAILMAPAGMLITMLYDCETGE